MSEEQHPCEFICNSGAESADESREAADDLQPQDTNGRSETATICESCELIFNSGAESASESESEAADDLVEKVNMQSPDSSNGRGDGGHGNKREAAACGEAIDMQSPDNGGGCGGYVEKSVLRFSDEECVAVSCVEGMNMTEVAAHVEKILNMSEEESHPRRILKSAIFFKVLEVVILSLVIAIVFVLLMIPTILYALPSETSGQPPNSTEVSEATYTPGADPEFMEGREGVLKNHRWHARIGYICHMHVQTCFVQDCPAISVLLDFVNVM